MPSVVLDELHMNYRSHCILERDPIPLLPSAILHTLTTILVCRIKSLSFKNVYEAATTLNTLDSDLLGSLVKMVHKCPETAVSLQCELLTDYNETTIDSTFRKIRLYVTIMGFGGTPCRKLINFVKLWMQLLLRGSYYTSILHNRFYFP